jgi:hypothetical protein
MPSPRVAAESRQTQVVLIASFTFFAVSIARCVVLGLVLVMDAPRCGVTLRSQRREN